MGTSKNLSSNLRCFTFLRQLVGLASASLVATLQAEEATTGRVVVAITSASIAPSSSWPGHIHTGGSYQIYQGNQEKNPRHVDSVDSVDLAVDLDIGILGSKKGILLSRHDKKWVCLKILYP